MVAPGQLGKRGRFHTHVSRTPPVPGPRPHPRRTVACAPMARPLPSKKCYRPLTGASPAPYTFIVLIGTIHSSKEITHVTDHTGQTTGRQGSNVLVTGAAQAGGHRAPRSPIVWPPTEQASPSLTPKAPTPRRPSSKRLNAEAERRSRSRPTPPRPTPFATPSTGLSRSSTGSTFW